MLFPKSFFPGHLAVFVAGGAIPGIPLAVVPVVLDALTGAVKKPVSRAIMPSAVGVFAAAGMPVPEPVG